MLLPCAETGEQLDLAGLLLLLVLPNNLPFCYEQVVVEHVGHPRSLDPASSWKMMSKLSRALTLSQVDS